MKLLLSCLLCLSLCGCWGDGAGKAIGLSKRPWLSPVQEFEPAEKAQLAVLKNIIWTDADKNGKPSLDEFSIGKNPVMVKLQNNYLAMKAEMNVYMVEAWRTNLNQLVALDWDKDAAIYSLTNELLVLGWSESEIQSFQDEKFKSAAKNKNVISVKVKEE